MKINVSNLESKDQTGRQMYKMVENFYTDLNDIPAADLPFLDFYNLVRKLPYKKDDLGAETVARPGLIWKHKKAGLDCKKKAVLLAAYARRRFGPGSYRFQSVSARPDKKIHHVLPEISLDNGNTWIRTDATYPGMRLGFIRLYTKTEELKP